MLRYALLLFLLLPLQRATSRLQTIEDPATDRQDREVHDVRRVVFDVKKEEIHVAIHFRRPLVEMMLERATLTIDCDDDAGTGMDGADLMVNAYAGSRFHPNAWKPDQAGIPPPLENLQAAFAKVEQRERGVERREDKNWTWKGRLPTPEASRNVLSFRFPQQLVRDGGQRYNRHVPVKLKVLGGCSEHPVPLRYRAGDEGVDITVDGKEGDWSGGPIVIDPGGELHRDALPLDIRSVQAEHSKGWLYVGIRLDRPGFGETVYEGGDIVDKDRIVIAVEPLGGQYQGYAEHVILSTKPERRGRTLRHTVGKGFVECAIARPDEQTSFRLAVWADALREDEIPDEGSFRLDTAPWRKR